MASLPHEQCPPTAKLPPWVTPAALAATLVGLLGTAAGLSGAAHVEDGGQMARDAWGMLLVNLLYWVGLAQGMVVWAAIFRTANATWTPAIGRLGRAAVHFLWVSPIAFAALYLGREHWVTWLGYPIPRIAPDSGHPVPWTAWTGHPPREIAAWLNVPFFFGRDAAALVLMLALSLWLVSAYRRGEAKIGTEREQAAHHGLNRIAATLVLAYTLAYSLLVFDLVMSLTPHWYSTLLGAYFFVSNLYLAMAGLIVLAVLLREPLGWQDRIGRRHLRDLGNLLLGFGLLTTGFFFAQFLTLWYGNLPEETHFVIDRVYRMPWRPVSLSLVALAYLGPFLLLTFPAVKMNPRLIGPVAALVMVAMWIERWVMVMPALFPDRLAGLGAAQWAMPLGFCGLLVLVVVASLRRRPEVSPLDERLELSKGVEL